MEFHALHEQFPGLVTFLNLLVTAEVCPRFTVNLLCKDLNPWVPSFLQEKVGDS